MAQWFALKALNPEALLFFRMGDFYEMFFGDAEAAETSLFSKFSDRHLFDWKEAPRDGTLYFFSDQAFAKPWTMTLFLVDASQRVWQLMRWPSPNWLIRTNEGDELNPSGWAVATMNDKLNCD